MRIAIDARAWGWAGVGRYTRNLLRQFAVRPEGNKFIVLLGKKDEENFRREIKGAEDIFEVKLVEPSYYSWREQIVFLRQLGEVRADLYHFTHFNVPLLFNRPYVVTIHDVTRFIFPGQRQQGFMRQVAYEYVFKHAVEKARGVICVSATTKRDLKDLPFVLPPYVETIYEAAGQEFRRQVTVDDRQRARLMLGTQDPYLLYVGVWMNHKNLPRMLAAYKLLLAKYPNFKLVLTGKPRPGYVDVPAIARRSNLGNDKIIYLGFVEQRLLPALYAEAACLLMPSLYEGFGLPALEAQQVGVPVVASHVSSLPEILGPGAYYVNPEYMLGIVKGVEQALGESQEIVAVRESSWEECAAATLSLYAKTR